MSTHNLDPDAVQHERHLDLLRLVKTGSWLDQQVFPPLQWAVKGVIPEGFVLLTGPPKLGKSYFVLHTALAVASGGRAYGRVDIGTARPVLYLALEDGDRRLQSRARELLQGEPIPELFEYVTRVPSGAILDLVDAWLEVHGEASPLVIIDTLGKVMPPQLAGESAYQRDYRIGGAIKARADRYPGTTVLVVHHTRKTESSDWMESTSGTNGLNGSADATISLSRARNENEGILRVTGRDVEEQELAMTVRRMQWMLQGDLAQAAAAARHLKVVDGLGDDSVKVVAFIEENPDGVRPTQVAAHMGWPDKKATSYLSNLLKSGRIARVGRGTYFPASTTPPLVSEVSEVFEGEGEGEYHTYHEYHTPLWAVPDEPPPDVDAIWRADAGLEEEP